MTDDNATYRRRTVSAKEHLAGLAAAAKLSSDLAGEHLTFAQAARDAVQSPPVQSETEELSK